MDRHAARSATTSGFSARSQPIRLPSRLFTSLMLKVAIFIGRA
jgi:hypothetical protein